MKLQSLRVSQFRKFAGTVEIRGLQPGLNLLHGPNEAGKSTLAAAVRTLFLERHATGGEAFSAALAPAGMAAPAPALEAAFLLGKAKARLTKQFLKAKRAELVIDGVRFEGAAADNELAQRLGFAMPGAGASRPEVQGIPGLLWIEQGRGADLADTVGHAAVTLKERLESILGEIGSSQGGAMAAAVERALRILRTASGRSTGPLKKLEEEYATAGTERDALAEKAGQFSELGQALAHTLASQAALERERPWEACERKRTVAASRLAALEPRQKELASQRQRLTELDARRRALGEASRQHDEAGKALARDRAALAEAQEQLESTRAALEAALGRQHKAAAGRDAAIQVHRRALAAQRRQAFAAELAHVEQECRRIDALLERAGRLAQKAAALRAEATGRSLPKDAVEELDGLEQQLREHRVREQALATGIHWRLQPGAHLDAGGHGRLEGEGSLRISSPLDLQLPGVGALRIEPGGEDVGRLAATGRRLADALKERCEQLGVTDAAAARTRQLEWQRILQQVDVLDAERKAVLDGRDEADWRSARAELEARRTIAAGQLDASGDAAAEEGAAIDVDSAARRLQQAESTLLGIEAEVERLREAARDAQLAHGNLQARIDAVAVGLEGEAATAAAAQRQQELAETVALHAALAQEITAAERALANEQPELLQADIERYTQTLEFLRKQREQLAQEIAGHRGRLAELGGEGIDERLAGAETRVEQLGRRLAAHRQRADALALLDRLIRERQQAVVERLYAPLRERIGHYLAILFPGTQARIALEDLELKALARDSGDELAFSDHSHGTREQLGLIARLAYADLLKDAGQPTLLMLDDALVHSDAGRREAMKRVLHEAARRHQILLFTCHPEHWRDAGAACTVDVAALQQAGHGPP